MSFGYQVLGFGGNRNYGAKGGIVITYSDNSYMSHTFTDTSGTQTFTLHASPSLTLDILIVGGGGGGGTGFEHGGNAGGGGAVAYRLLTGISLAAGDYNVQVGSGGAGAIYDGTTGQSGAKGGDSYFGSYTAEGGGFGGGLGAAGGNGGSGGGAATGSGGTSGPYGNDGGDSDPNDGSAASGGGATGAGSYGHYNLPGGAGASSTYRDGTTSVTYATGGIGNSTSPGGGTASVNSGNGGRGVAGQDNWVVNKNGDTGGSGIVIIRYAV